MSDPRAYFLALEPDNELRDRVLSYKRTTREQVGDQLYLDDLPHMTLCLALFESGEAVWEAVEGVLGRIAVPEISIVGWHVFQADPLTGNHTLVLDVAEASREVLRGIQDTVIRAVKGLRDKATTEARYAANWHHLSEAEQDNVREFGFPFVGSDWHPHLTIASIRPDDWSHAWGTLEHDPPVAVSQMTHLALYAFEEQRPVEFRGVRLETARES